MGEIRGLLKLHSYTHVSYRCPGCGDTHMLRVGGEGRPAWGFNGDYDRPTFTPSVLVQSGHHVSGWKPGDGCWCGTEDAAFGCYVCHSFVENGQVRFLGDCTHALAGQTVPLPPYSQED